MHRPVGDSIMTVYDMAFRVLSRDYRLKANSPSGTIADQDTFTYDSSSRMLIGVSGRYGNTVTNTFDNAGRLSTESLTIGGQTYTVTSEYDLRSQRKKVTYPNSSTWERTYTARRQLYETKYNGSTVDTRAYDNGGRLDTSTYANGVAADYNWRADNLLTDIGFSHPGGVAANRRIGTYTYAWDANKNKTKETITGQIPGYSFDTTLGTDPDGYDDEDRLTYFKRQSTTNPQTWNLSLVGDWNSWSNFGTAQNRTHGPAHEILTAGNTPNNAFTHDVKGNMTDIPSNILSPARKLFWDFDNQLTGVDTTGDSTPEVTYEYDVLHRRVARIEGSNSKVYIHSGNQIIADYNRGSAANTTPAFRYVWGDYIDEPILRQTGSTTILYYHRNQQYSTIALTNTSGEVVERYGYTAYGQMIVMNYLGNVRSWTDWSNRFLYTGREWDDSTKLFHFRARWYEPMTGRFVSRDPLGYAGAMSLQTYSLVLQSVDPFGLLIQDPIVGAGIAGSIPFSGAMKDLVVTAGGVTVRGSTIQASTSLDGKFGYLLPISISMKATFNDKPVAHKVFFGSPEGVSHQNQLWQLTEVELQELYYYNSDSSDILKLDDVSKAYNVGDVVDISDFTALSKFKHADIQAWNYEKGGELSTVFGGYDIAFAIQVKKIQTGFRPFTSNGNTVSFDAAIPKISPAKQNFIPTADEESLMRKMTVDPGFNAKLVYVYINKKPCMTMDDEQRILDALAKHPASFKPFNSDIKIDLSDFSTIPSTFEYLSYVGQGAGGRNKRKKIWTFPERQFKPNNENN